MGYMYILTVLWSDNLFLSSLSLYISSLNINESVFFESTQFLNYYLNPLLLHLLLPLHPFHRN